MSDRTYTGEAIVEGADARLPMRLSARGEAMSDPVPESPTPTSIQPLLDRYTWREIVSLCTIAPALGHLTYEQPYVTLAKARLALEGVRDE